MSRSLFLDTSTFSAVLRKDPAYEIRRGLLKRDAQRLLDYFQRLIAAQANRRGAGVVTDNVKDFRGIADVVETWS
jgi:predicted nucleic acid-binding protein